MVVCPKWRLFTQVDYRHEMRPMAFLEGRFSYPGRRETGIERVTKMDTPAIKSHRKSNSLDFLVELEQFTRDN